VSALETEMASRRRWFMKLKLTVENALLRWQQLHSGTDDMVESDST